MSSSNEDMDLAVVGLGMVSAGGFQAAECVATIRARLSQFVELAAASRFLREDDKDPAEPVTATGGCVPGLEESMTRAERCARMGEHALRQAIGQAAGQGLPRRLALLAALPDCTEPDLLTTLRAVMPSAPVAIDRLPPVHGGALLGLDRAALLLRQRHVELCLVGGVDSWIDRDLLWELNRVHRLKHSKSMEGFIPGEAAAFLAVESPESARQRGQPILVRITGLGLAEEEVGPDAEQACLGVGLSQAIRTAVRARFSTERIDLIVCDLNGEAYRHEEWGAAVPKCVDVSPKEFRLWHPADTIGDVGAASAATNLVAAVLGLTTGATRRREALVWGSSEGGQRGAAVLSRAE